MPHVSSQFEPTRKIKSDSSRFKIGYADTVGRRPNMEDEITVVGSFRGSKDEDLIGVFDGHSGKEASAYASNHLHHIVAEQLEHNSDISEVLKSSFFELNEKMKKEDLQSGTTALVALFIKDIGYIANCGDTRAVLYNKGTTIRCSIDHRPEEVTEMKRLESTGGTITTTINKVGKVTSRICGLSVSRALGDFNMSPHVISDPYIHGPIQVYSEDCFLILACDGLWDMMKDEEATNIISSIMDPEEAAIRLRDFAYKRGSTDNITVLVLRFPLKPL